MGGWDGKVRDRGGENTQERKHMHRVSGCCAARSQAGRSSGLGEEAMDAGRSHIQSSSRENAASPQARKSLPLKKKKSQRHPQSLLSHQPFPPQHVSLMGKIRAQIALTQDWHPSISYTA